MIVGNYVCLRKFLVRSNFTCVNKGIVRPFSKNRKIQQKNNAKFQFCYQLLARSQCSLINKLTLELGICFKSLNLRNQFAHEWIVENALMQSEMKLRRCVLLLARNYGESFVEDNKR